ncbi:MAG: hypothetical protein JXR70_10555 [Spirochaetales bacterium]|nr:hypothetical protein [Spirochaetales bacterium]
MKKELVCYCEYKFEADFPEEVDLAENAKAVQEILSGQFMVAQCPSCGKELKPEFPFHLLNFNDGSDLYFIPELDRFKYIMGKYDLPVKDPYRVVIGYSELVEKITIFRDELQDQVIELVKYYLLNKALEEVDDDSEVEIIFHGMENEKLIFHISGLKPDQLAVTEIKLSMYEKLLGELPKRLTEQPFRDFLSPPYVSISRMFFDD